MWWSYGYVSKKDTHPPNQKASVFLLLSLETFRVPQQHGAHLQEAHTQVHVFVAIRGEHLVHGLLHLRAEGKPFEDSC